MNILKNMEAIFLAAVVLAGVSGLANAAGKPAHAVATAVAPSAR
ncbi:hypothetical protein [Massilia glaciei]|nr:hypothetical protein [Massilia glaciei]